MFENLTSNGPLAGLLRSLSRSPQPETSASPSPGWADGPTIAISRQVGARGTTIARVVAARLGWPIYDNELLETMSRQMDISLPLLECRDEKTASWLAERFSIFSPDDALQDNSFRHHLVRVLFALACKGHCVIVGRGAAQALPAATTLRVRLVAALEDRVLWMARKLEVSPEDAVRQVQRRDRERNRFVKVYFHRDPTDPLQYDLLVNTSRFEDDEAAELIIRALQPIQTQADNAVVDPYAVGMT